MVFHVYIYIYIYNIINFKENIIDYLAFEIRKKIQKEFDVILQGGKLSKNYVVLLLLVLS